MPYPEPFATAVLLTTLGLLLVASVLLTRASRRSGLPVALLFLVLGMVAGSRNWPGLAFANFHTAFRLGSVALALILFDGGLNMPRTSLRKSLAPASVLATLGVVATALAVGLFAHLLGLTWGAALVLGAVVSSTDAAAVFSVLRGSGVQLKQRMAATLELESGLNDPVAVILTLAFTASLVSGKAAGWGLVPEALAQIAIGLVIGGALGLGGAWVLKRVQLPAGGLYPVLTLALALLAFGLPTLLGGSGFLAVYLAGYLIGNRAIRYRSALLRVHDAFAWLAQVLMFLVLGLLIAPRQLISAAGPGLAIGLFLALVARPAVVFALLTPFRMTVRERLYVGAVGLRGAVPIILATYPVLANAPDAFQIFELAFFVVVLNTVVPGAAVPWLTRKLHVESHAPPPSPASLEFASTQLLRGEVVSFFISKASAASGATLAELPFPDGAAAMVVVRGSDLIAPRGQVALAPGDHLFVVCRSSDLPLLELLFGSAEAD